LSDLILLTGGGKRAARQRRAAEARYCARLISQKANFMKPVDGGPA